MLLTTALAALIPAAAVAMPVAPALPGASVVIPVQGLPEYYRWDPCMPGAPSRDGDDQPTRRRATDPDHRPGLALLRGGGGYYQRPAAALL